jgi:HAD superfamily hydrolase (TIGR01509 family)
VRGRFDLVIFDCDGVLVDSERLSIRLDAELLHQLGWDLTDEEIVERWVGRTEAAMKAEIADHLGRDIDDEWSAFAERYDQAFAEELEPVEGIAEAVDAIQAAGFATCVASSGGPAKIRRNLAKTGLLERFEGRLFSANDVEHGKPSPDLFFHAAEVMGVAPERTAVIEDSAHGVAAGLAAGMTVFAYTGGVTPAERLTGPGVVQFADMRQLPALLRVAGR